MSRIFDVLILIALPASGKSEIRRYLDSLPPATLREDFHLGETVQLDDFPYVHFLRRIDDVVESLGRPRPFFPSASRPFRDPREWGTLIELLNEDFAALGSGDTPKPPSAAYYLFDRIDAARRRVELDGLLAELPGKVRARLAAELEPESREFLEEQRRSAAIPLAGKTVVLELARGGPEGSRMPLGPPMGYGAAFARFSETILRRAVVLYVWVTPEESRRKNAERGDPNDPGSILHHTVPEEVMRHDYGCDDIDWLLAISETPDRIRVPSKEGTFAVPLVRFDNRADRTSFLRRDPATWGEDETANLHAGLAAAFRRLADAQADRPG